MPDTKDSRNLKSNYPLDKSNHGTSELHKIGQSLLDPSYVAPIPLAAVGAVGQSDEVARADHVHPLSSELYDQVVAALAPTFRFAQVNPKLNDDGEVAVKYETPFPAGTTRTILMLSNPRVKTQLGVLLGFYNSNLKGFTLKALRRNGTPWNEPRIYIQYLAIGI